MFNANASGHYKTLKGFTKSAEYSRIKLTQQIKDGDGGMYKVKMEESDTWQIMDSPPAAGALEWLYINAAGVPLYYWKKGQEGLTII